MSLRRRFLLGVTLCAIAFGYSAQAGKNYQVFDVRRNLAMHSKDAVTRDYYVNAGTQDGLKAGMVLSVYRRDPIFDAYDDIRDDLYAPVGQIKLIHVQRTLSIARLIAVSKMTAHPIVDFRSVMIGDRIDLKSATMGDGTFEDDEGASAPAESGSGSAPVEAATTGTPVTGPTTPATPSGDKTAKAETPPLVKAPTPPPAEDTKTTKKVPDASSLSSEENQPVVNTQ